MHTLNQFTTTGITASPRTRQRGFSLIEVLVAVLVLSIGLLGLALLQAQGLVFNSNAYYRTQATLLAYDMMDRMRTNRGGAAGGDYDVPDQNAAETARAAYTTCKSAESNPCNCTTSNCDTVNLAKYDLGVWYDLIASLVPENPGALSTIEKNGNIHTITIRWRERDITRAQQWVIEL